MGLLAQKTSADKARTLFAESCDVFKENGDLRNVSRVLCHQGYNSLALGDVADAQQSFFDALRLAREGGYAPFAVDALAGMALMWANNSDDERALELALSILQNPAITHDAKTRVGILRAELESRLTPQQAQAAEAQARKQSFDQVVSQVLGQNPSDARHSVGFELRQPNDLGRHTVDDAGGPLRVTHLKAQRRDRRHDLQLRRRLAQLDEAIAETLGFFGPSP